MKKKFRGRGGYPIPRLGHIKVSLRTYKGGLSPFIGFYILLTKRNCRQRDLNIGMDSKENDSY